MSGAVIVSRHPAAVEFIRRESKRAANAPVFSAATPGLVRGKTVFGNLPLGLAAYASEVWTIEFRGTPPRGREYTIEEMDAAGAFLDCFTVQGASWSLGGAPPVKAAVSCCGELYLDSPRPVYVYLTREDTGGVRVCTSRCGLDTIRVKLHTKENCHDVRDESLGR